MVQGSNVITVNAQTTYGTTSASVTVNFSSSTSQGEIQKPEIVILSPLPDTFLAAPPIVTGLVSGPAAVTTVRVNGLPAETAGLNTPYVSFKAAAAVAQDQQSLTITVSAVDAQNRSAELEYSVSIDTQAPVIALDGTAIQAPPAVNQVGDSPHIVSGTVTDANMAGLSINDQPVYLEPTGDAHTYAFSAGLALTYGEEQLLTLSAWDQAGNRTGTEWLVRLDSNLTIEVISPGNGAELQARGDLIDVGVTVRVSGADSLDQFMVVVDDAAPTALTRTGSVGNGSVTVSAQQSEHRLTAQVLNSSGTLISSTTTQFSVLNTDNIPLSVTKMTPANGAKGVEPNDPIAVYFNKAIEPELLQIEVLETVHGKTYASPDAGADITQLTKTAIVDVNRDREPVPGGLGHFPQNRMAAFYPGRDLSYGAVVYITVTYDGKEAARGIYNVRPLPTFVEGTVLNAMYAGVAGIEITIADLGLSATSDGDGGFGFGFKLPSDQNLPGGRYKVVANPGMKERRFGTVEQWVNITQGRMNSMPAMMLPTINPNTAFRRIVSGSSQNILADGALTLDLSDAALVFQDLRDQGDVHVQLLDRNALSHGTLPGFAPAWMFAVQPGGIKVSGQVGLQIALPSQNGSYSYAAGRGEYFILLGLHPDALMIVPVGLARLDADTRLLKSLQPVALQRLDYIGFALTPVEAYPLIEQCVKGEISFDQMVGQIENMR